MAVRIIGPANVPVSTGEDVARSLHTGGAEGLAGFVSQLGDIQQLGHLAYDKAAQFARNHGVNLPTSTQLSAITPPSVGTYLGALAQAVAKREGADQKLAKMAPAFVAPLVPGATSAAPTSAQVLAAATRGQPLYQPQTTAGKYARTIAQFAPAAAMPVNAEGALGQVTGRALKVVAPAVASETAGQFTAGTPYESYARAAAATAAGLGATALTGPDASTKMLARAVSGANDDQLAAAQQRMVAAANEGAPITWAEAIQAETGNATGMGRMQRFLEATRPGQEKLGPMMAERPDQARQMVMNYADTISPPAADPYLLGSQAKDAAGNVLTGVRQEINANARPWYDALKDEHLSVASPSYQELSLDPAYQEALTQVRSDPILNKGLEKLPDNNLAVTDAVVQHLNNLAENTAPNPAASTGNATISARYEAAARAADQLASGISEPWRLSRAMVASGHDAFLDPLKVGPMGAISQTPKIGAQTRALFPSAPPEGAAPITSQTLEMLPPDVSAGLVRQHIVNTYNEAAQDLQPGPNQWGGAKFATVVSANPEQQATLTAGVNAAGGDPERLANILDTLKAQGTRMFPGSPTAEKLKDFDSLKALGLGGQIADSVVNPFAITHKLSDALEGWQARQNANRLVDALMSSPDGPNPFVQARQVAPQNFSIPATQYLLLGAPSARGDNNGQ